MAAVIVSLTGALIVGGALPCSPRAECTVVHTDPAGGETRWMLPAC